MARRYDSKADRTYEEFEPIARWSAQPEFDTLTIYLPGFRKEQLKVQVTSNRKLRVMGERPTQGNNWLRFRKEFPIQSNIDIDAISAKFEAVNLVVKLPKPEKKAKPAPENGRRQPPVSAKKQEGASRGTDKALPPKPTTGKPAEKREAASRGPEKVSLPKPAMEKLAEKKEDASRGAGKVPVPRPAAEKPAEKKEEVSRGSEKVQRPRTEEEEASREAMRARPPKPATETPAEKEEEEASRRVEKVKQKEVLRNGNQELACELKTYKEAVEGFVREMMSNPRATTGVVVGAAVVALAAGIYAGRRLSGTFGDP